MRNTFLTLALFVFLIPVTTFASVSQKLGKEYVSNKAVTGMDFRLQLPLGWKVKEEASALVILAPLDEVSDAFIKIQYEGDPGNVLWVMVQKNLESGQLPASLQIENALIDGREGYELKDVSSKDEDKKILFPVQDAAYNIQMHIPQAEWKKSGAGITASIETFRAKEKKVDLSKIKIGTTGSASEKVAKKLDKVYVVDEKKYGIGLRIQPPQGWVFAGQDDTVSFYNNAFSPEAGLVFSREVDTDGSWDHFQKLAGILSEKQLKQLFQEFTPEWISEADIIKLKSKEKIDGKAQGFSMEFKMKNDPSARYGKVILFAKDGYIYKTGAVSTGGKKAWDKFKGIMAKSMQTLRVAK